MTKRMLIYHVYDVFTRIDKNRVVDAILVKRKISQKFVEVPFEINMDEEAQMNVIIDEQIVQWVHPDKPEFIYAGTIGAPLTWLNEEYWQGRTIIEEEE